MKRRFIIRAAAGVTLGVSASGWPPSIARAQKPGRPALVVYLGTYPLQPGEKEASFDWTLKGLRDLGYIEGKNLTFEYRHANGKPEQRPALIAEQIKRKADIFYSTTPEMVLAAMGATRSIPIVFVGIGDPVGAGIVESLARPGRNATGLSWDSNPEIAAKEFQLLREMVPSSRILAMLWNPDIKGSAAMFGAALSAAKVSGVELRSFEVRAPAELDAAFASMAAARVQAVLVMGSWFSWLYREPIAVLAARYRLPAIYGNRDMVLAGGLMSYGPNVQHLHLGAAVYIDKLLKGAKPADLPVGQPTKFEFLVNLKTAKALALEIPAALRMQVDEVID